MDDNGETSTLTLDDDGICFFPSTSSNWVRQYIEDSSALAGRTIIMSILVGAGNGTNVRCGCNDGTLHYGGFVSSGIAEVTVSINKNVKELFVFFQCDKTAKSPSIKAAKLELGPVQNLAHKEGGVWVLNDPAPNKALELAKCQRYQENDISYSVLERRSPLGAGRRRRGLHRRPGRISVPTVPQRGRKSASVYDGRDTAVQMGRTGCAAARGG